MAEFDLLFQGGTIINGSGSVLADMYVKNGKVAAIVDKGNPKLADKTIDATGKWLLPGVIDAHSHTDMVTYSDQFEDFVRGACCGGVTTILSFVRKRPTLGLELMDSLKKWIEDGSKTALCDFGAHALFLPGDDPVSLVPQIIDLGIPSFKIFMAYGNRGFQLDDDFLMKAMDSIAKAGGVMMLHAENGSMINYFEHRNMTAGKIAPMDFVETRPGIAEAEAVFRGYNLARSVGCPVYFVHQSAKESIPVLKLARKQNDIEVYAETCPQYLILKNEILEKWGSLAKVAPPLRFQEDLDAMWQACEDGTLNVIGSDHAGYTRATQHQDDPNIFTAIFGMPVVEFMLENVYEHGVYQKRISVSRMVKMLSENPAKIFGLYPSKGTLQVGSDADIVVFDPESPHILTEKRMHTKSDYLCFEGMTCHGSPTQVYLRGNLVAENMEPVGNPGIGKYLSRTPNSRTSL